MKMLDGAMSRPSRLLVFEPRAYSAVYVSPRVCMCRGGSILDKVLGQPTLNLHKVPMAEVVSPAGR